MKPTFITYQKIVVAFFLIIVCNNKVVSQVYYDGYLEYKKGILKESKPKNYSLKVHVFQPGTLISLVHDSIIDRISSLTITGNINSRDAKFIRDPASAMYVHRSDGPYSHRVPTRMGLFLKYLNLEDAVIEENDSIVIACPLQPVDYTPYPPLFQRNISLDNHIQPHMFSGCKFKNIILPKTTTVIDSFAFFQCSSLESIRIPENVTEIGFNAFEQCVSLRRVLMQNSNTEIKQNAFIRCNSLEDITVINCTTFFNGEMSPFGSAFRPGQLVFINGRTRIGKRAFQKLEIKTVIFDNCYTEIDEMAFSNSTIIDIEFSNKYTKIKNKAFRFSTLSHLEIGKGYTEIGDSAFYSCSSLRTLSLYKNVKTIGAGAFNSCGKLQEIICESPIPVQIDNSTFNGVDNYCKVYVPRGSLERYKKAGWSYLDLIEL
jgi:hypothetical protein